MDADPPIPAATLIVMRPAVDAARPKSWSSSAPRRWPSPAARSSFPAGGSIPPTQRSPQRSAAPTMPRESPRSARRSRKARCSSGSRRVGRDRSRARPDPAGRAARRRRLRRPARRARPRARPRRADPVRALDAGVQAGAALRHPVLPRRGAARRRGRRARSPANASRPNGPAPRRCSSGSRAGSDHAIFPTKRNLERLARFATIDEARADAALHSLDTIIPWVEERDGEPHVCIPADRGYPVTSEPLDDRLSCLTARRIGCLLLLAAARRSPRCSRWREYQRLVREEPERFPWTPLSLTEPIGRFTGRKLAALGDDPARCEALARRGRVGRSRRRAAGAAADARLRLRPRRSSCARRPRRAALRARRAGHRLPGRRRAGCCGSATWSSPPPRRHFGERVAAHRPFRKLFVPPPLRPQRGRATASMPPPMRSTSPASAWPAGAASACFATGTATGADAAFLREVRDGACDLFATVLSPDYNAAHADHLHLDQAARGAIGLARLPLRRVARRTRT